MSAKIQSPGLSTHIQDFGRAGHRSFGIPLSGAADRLSLALANYCVGNRFDQAGLEITLGGPELTLNSACTLALCGAQTEFSINGKRAAMNTAHHIKAQSTITIGRVLSGARSYLAFSGGVNGKEFLGSVSTYSYARLGGYEGRSLRAGDTLRWGKASASPQTLPIGIAPRYDGAIVLRAMKGPEFDWLDTDAQRKLFQMKFTASSQTDRMGSRLKSEGLTLQNSEQMISAPLLPGTVQLPQGGQPIIILADGHCTGGYPRIAQVIHADHHKLGQIKAGTPIYFRACRADEAIDILKKRTAFYRSLMPGFSF